MKLCVYCTGHKHSKQVCEAFAQGRKARVLGPGPWRPGMTFMYGCLRGSYPTLKQAQKHEAEWPWFYADNGYFLAGKTEESYFRVTRNALQHDGRGGSPDLTRWQRLGLDIKPWRRTGERIIICPPSRLFASLMGFDADQWLAKTRQQLQAVTRRPLSVRMKMSWHEIKMQQVPPLHQDLADAWAVVTHSSNAAVDAVLLGVPVFCTHPCAAYVMGEPHLSKIERPRYPDDRERWAAVLANNQWLLSEMRDGTCWKQLNDGRA